MKGNIYIPQTAYLKTLFQAVWQPGDHEGFNFETIVPKGVMEIIFDFGEAPAVKAKLGDKQFQLPRCFINGFNTGPIQRELPERNNYFGIQLHPLAIKHLFGVPAHEFANRVVDLTLVDKSVSSLWHQMAEQPSFKRKVTIVSEWCEGKAAELCPREKLLNDFFANPYLAAPGVNELADTLCYSTRHLSRKIYEVAQMNAEEMLCYKKYLRALHLIHSGNFSLTEIACRSNFADQSHFIKSFKKFAGLTPGEYRQRKSHLPGHIYQNVR